MTGKRQYRVAVVYHAPVYQEGIALVLEQDERLRITARYASLDALASAAPQQAVVLRLMARSDSPTYASIAQELGIGVRTVESYRDDLFAKFDVHTRGALLYRARELRLV